MEARPCSKCGEPRDREPHRYCRSCHNAYVREHRSKTTRSPEARVRDRAREVLRQAVRAGHLRRQPCEVCGSEPTEGHHPDYAHALEVRWLCKTHHAELHRFT